MLFKCWSHIPPGWKSHVPAHFLNEELKCIDVKTYANCWNGVQDMIRKIYQSSKRWGFLDTLFWTTWKNKYRVMLTKMQEGLALPKRLLVWKRLCKPYLSQLRDRQYKSLYPMASQWMQGFARKMFLKNLSNSTRNVNWNRHLRHLFVKWPKVWQCCSMF